MCAELINCNWILYVEF